MTTIQAIEQVASEAIAAINQAKPKAIAKINTDATPKHNLDQSVVVAGINWSAHLTPSEHCDAPSMFNETTGVHYFDQESAILHAYNQNLRLPTKDEMQQLYDRTTQRFVEIGDNTYCVFTDKETNTDLWVVLGGLYDCDYNTFFGDGIHGYLWSSSVYDAIYGFDLYIHESAGVIPRNPSYRADGFPVRCVIE